MDFKVKTPCKDCPFRNDIEPFLTKERVKEIIQAITNDNTFYCHKTIYSNEYEELDKKKGSHCVGALILLHKENKIKANFLLRLALMGKMFKVEDLDLKAPVFESFVEMIDNQDY